MSRMRPDPMTKIERAGGNKDMLFPAGNEREVEEIVRKIPSHVRPHVEAYIGHCSNELQRFMLAALAAKAVDLETRPNASFTMYPHGLSSGANAVVNTVYALDPFSGATDQGTYSFVEGQRFYGITTGHADTLAGWAIAANSLKFSIDAISGVLFDTSFAQWEPDMVASRVTTGEYEGREILEQVNFFCSAILRSVTAAPMVEGVTVSLYDRRCMNENMIKRHFGAGESFSEMLRDLMEGYGSGWGPHRLWRRVVEGR